MDLKRKNDEFFVMPLKRVSSDMDLVNQSETPKLWAIAHENGHQMFQDEFVGIPLQNVPG
jgi:hypothetical protein